MVKHSGQSLTVTPLRCRCWSCSYCAPHRARELRRAAIRGEPTIFLTLTMRQGTFATPDRQAVEMAKGLRMLLQYLRRTLGRPRIPFLVVFEKHKSGWPHMHVLLRTNYIDHRLIRAWWVERFDSPRIDIRRLDSKRRAAFYVTKYMAKDPTAFEGTKRYWSSRDYIIPRPDDAKPEHPDDVWWEAITCTPLGLANAALDCGAAVTFDGPRIIIRGWLMEHRRCWGLS